MFNSENNHYDKNLEDLPTSHLNENVGSTVLQTCHITLTLCAYDMAVICNISMVFRNIMRNCILAIWLKNSIIMI